ncbi:hypothetical protein DFH06DRAFT_750486 [Mycena polygramma]|nr:hypothetical protein DFH06DRAFT_750486 [Mycena polygramma]
MTVESHRHEVHLNYCHPLDAPATERDENINLAAPNAEVKVVTSMTHKQFHILWALHGHGRHKVFTVSTRVPLRPDVIVFYSPSGSEAEGSDSESFIVVAEPKGSAFRWIGWAEKSESRWCQLGDGGLAGNSWTRYSCSDPDDELPPLQITPAFSTPDDYAFQSAAAWMAGANHIFHLLQAKSHLENYFWLEKVEFRLRWFDNPHNQHLPDGYLFVCPNKDFNAGECTFRWPDCPAYWSLDPTGADRLSTEDAKILGFPILHRETFMEGRYWDNGVYAGLRRFQEAEGYNPDSQDASKDLGYPLYELPSELGAPAACHNEGEAFYGDWRGSGILREAWTLPMTIST